jgi:hypothetical protein
MKKTFYIGIREVHVSTRAVEAESEEEALALIVNGVEDGEEVICEYSRTLDPDTWTVEEAPNSKEG